jgi:DNA-binding NtrC family response regulator
MNSKLNVLIVDDEQELRHSVISILQTSLPEFEITVDEACDGARAVERVGQKDFDLVLMDVRMPEMDGLEALRLIKRKDPRIFIVIMTAHANLEDAVLAIREGAYDYVEKPVQPDRLVSILKKAIETQEMVSGLTVESPIFDDDVESEFVGSNRKMREVFDVINKLSHVDTTVLIRGENGTGKELVAKAIHHSSPRKEGEFIALNCGAIPEELMESELFGHEKGAFTDAHERRIGKFQLASRGTIFLDEIAEMRPEMQVKLLRVLQEKTFMPVGSNREVKTSARVIAATNQNLEKLIEDGLFREDLFYRLNVMPIFLPPLRDRIDDLEQLIEYFMKKFNLSFHKQIRSIDPEALRIMKSYRWPGNIRELENVIEHAFVVETGASLSVHSLPESVLKGPTSLIDFHLPQNYSGPLDFDRFKEQTEKEFIVQALKANHGRINKTVATANIPKNTLLRKIRKYSINVKEMTEDAGF